MSAPRLVAVAAASPAARAGLQVGDQLLAIGGRVPRDVIAYQLLVDEPDLELLVGRGHEELSMTVLKAAGEPLGVEVHSALFDRVRTCDNHCEFCFIHQLPKGMRRSLYMKDDDYRLSFLYGNFTTLTRFTELDLERVLTERLSPLFVSIHATDPDLRAQMLRNRRGAMSLRWLAALLEGGIEVHGQIVVCPEINDGPALDASLTGILDEYPQMATVACVPLGVSRYTTEQSMRPHTAQEAAAVVDLVEQWQDRFLDVLGRRMVYAADEVYLLADRPFPALGAYDGFPQHENGIGMARAFEAAFWGDDDAAFGVRPGFFAWVDGAPPEGYRATRTESGRLSLRLSGSRDGMRRPVRVITGEYGARVLGPLLAAWQGRHSQVPGVAQVPGGDGPGGDGQDGDAQVMEVRNQFFGGNTAVTGLLTGADVARALENAPEGIRYLLPDVCLSGDRFLDGMAVADLPRRVEVVPADGRSLRLALERR